MEIARANNALPLLVWLLGKDDLPLRQDQFALHRQQYPEGLPEEYPAMNRPLLLPVYYLRHLLSIFFLAVRMPLDFICLKRR